VVLLAVGYPFSFMCEVDLFVVVLLGAFALMLGPLLFGIAFLRKGVLPRYGRVLPLFTGLMGFVWLFFTGSETGRQLTFSFMIFRSLFALGWILLGYVLWSDGREIIEDPSTTGLGEAKARRSQPPISNGDRSSSYSERRRLHR
jgi:hypothetical protein